MSARAETRIEAAGRAIYFAWNNTPYLREVSPPEEGECLTFAEHALAAADSFEVSIAGKLATVFRSAVAAMHSMDPTYAPHVQDEARAVLSLYEQSQERA